jgi:NAD(P)-dependent dehydrogenase (short-subunit alcohol dehydrogenase family)
MSDLSGRTTIVVGASRGLGHGVATALAEAGAPVITVSRTEAEFPVPGNGSGSIEQVLADAGDAAVAADLVERHRPDNVVLVAGAVPHMAPLTEQTWETFSVTWEADVRIAFHWVREILRNPLRPGSRVVVFSSGAALAGSPLSGGYAGAKSTQRFIAAYAQGEAKRGGLDIAFTTLLPRFAPTAAVGRAGVEAYAAQSGVTVEQFLSQQGPLLTPEIAGAAVADLLREDAAALAPAYVLSGAGTQKLP